MTTKGVLVMAGSGQSTNYQLTPLGRAFADIDAEKYCAVEPDKRLGSDHYNFDLLKPLD